MKFSIQGRARIKTTLRPGILTFILLIGVVILPAIATAEPEFDDEPLSKNRRQFLEDCRTHAYNSNCARFFEAKNLKRKSEAFCREYPEDASCIELLEEKERVQESRRRVSVHRELAEFCQQNQDAPRCLSRGRKHQRRHQNF